MRKVNQIKTKHRDTETVFHHKSHMSMTSVVKSSTDAGGGGWGGWGYPNMLPVTVGLQGEKDKYKHQINNTYQFIKQVHYF